MRTIPRSMTHPHHIIFISSRRRCLIYGRSHVKQTFKAFEYTLPEGWLAVFEDVVSIIVKLVLIKRIAKRIVFGILSYIEVLTRHFGCLKKCILSLIETIHATAILIGSHLFITYGCLAFEKSHFGLFIVIQV